jgi:hypothetical protein
MGNHHPVVDLTERYQVTSKVNTASYVLIGLGIALFAAGAFMSGNATRITANLLHNGIFFSLITLVSIFFISFNYMANAGWSVVIKRIPEAISQVFPIFGAILVCIMLYILFAGRDDIFHWLNKEHVAHDELLKGKSSYLNVPFMTFRIITYFTVWTILGMTLYKYSVKEDSMPAGSLKYFKKSRWMAGVFLVFFAVTISTSSWDWLMSIDPHWYSTMYGWYVFASAFVSGMSLTMLIIQYLRSQGHLKNVSDEHVHDLGKFMFAFSVFWTYLWYSQYMLIWYSNNPEETIYFRDRIDHYKVLFVLNLILNFVTPLLVLMTRGNKRNSKIVIFMASVILLGHWIDFYQMIMPGTLGASWSIGPMEIGLPLIFLGILINRVFAQIAKLPLVPQNHPYLNESLGHHT